ncbi:inner membrane protein [Oleiphilus messinensis]|uniref:Heme exporter protein D n=1 Tax=Oleiphilus messinensis TaxID=141451 RepID=A0A1Y0I9Q7_9GAMM|nr:heme exporter protein CcmD [Oleiphilus messinensis]ARU57257.1 inner membrane protein [Oleiphilus messinensis]
MEFASLSEFLEMGGHGPYVWTAYAVTIVIMIANIVSPILKRKAIIKKQAQKLRRERLSQ